MNMSLNLVVLGSAVPWKMGTFSADGYSSRYNLVDKVNLFMIKIGVNLSKSRGQGHQIMLKTKYDNLAYPYLVDLVNKSMIN